MARCSLSWTGGTATALSLAVALSIVGCTSRDQVRPLTAADEKPMVAPTASAPSDTFNLQVATPLTNPPRPSFTPVPVLEAPPPPVVLTPLAAPPAAVLAALPEIPAPAPAPQRGKPIPVPSGPIADTVGPIEAPPGTEPPSTQPAPHRQQASLPAPPRSATTAAQDATYRLVYAPQMIDLPDTAPPVLQQLAKTMAQDPALRLKVNSFASGIAADPVAARKLSLQRGLKLREALVALGVSSLRVDILALGLTAADAPPDRIDIVPANPAN